MTFAGPAREYVRSIEKRFVLIDGVKLSELMMDHDVGVSVTNTYRLHRLDTDHFDQDLDAQWSTSAPRVVYVS